MGYLYYIINALKGNNKVNNTELAYKREELYRKYFQEWFDEELSNLSKLYPDKSKEILADIIFIEFNDNVNISKDIYKKVDKEMEKDYEKL